ncbi:MAG: serine/threonine protein kinase, partial [Nannocystaceae bacterium]
YVAESVSMTGGFTKKIAIKRILPKLVKEPRFVRMFLDEARLSLRFNHANIVSVLDIGESDSTYFIVMEFVEGTNAKQLLEHQAKRGGQMPVPLAVWILTQVLSGLQYAHDLRDSDGKHFGIVHRDISPPNILISWNGEVKLTDFGLAKATTQLESTDPGVVKGKYAYLSPEAAHLQAVDHRADIFSVGILAYEMLTGQRLFKGKNDYETIAFVRKATVPSMRRYNPRVPERLETIIGKSLAKSVDERYQTADEFAEDLLDWLFEAGNKVSSRDLIRYIRDFQAAKEAEDRLREAKSQKELSSGGGNLIIGLIQEEMLNFRSLGATGEEQQEGPVGSTPIVSTLTDVPTPRSADPSRPLDLDLGGFSAKPPPSQADVPSLSALLQDAETSNSEATPLVASSQSQSVAQAEIRAKPPVPTGDNGNPLVKVVIVMAIIMVGLLVYALTAT